MVNAIFINSRAINEQLMAQYVEGSRRELNKYYSEYMKQIHGKS